MSNSFYYFFSTTPQVLAGILALFGVFIIFKIQTLKSELIGIGQYILEKGNRLIRIPSIGVKFSKTENNTSILDRIEKDISRNDIKGLKSTIELIDYQDFELSIRKYNNVSDFLQSLIKSTIKWSIYTAIVIILCLAAIPFGDLILKNVYILYSLFTIMIVCITLSFYGLISILRKALIDSNSTIINSL